MKSSPHSPLYNFLLTRWKKLCHQLNIHDLREQTFQDIFSRYSESHRHYHTPTHLKDCLLEFDPVRSRSPHPHEIECALWFHDVIYDTHATDNEEKSAAYANTELENLGLTKPFRQRVTDLILTTKTHVPRTVDEKILVDVDLSILGRSSQVFEAYEQRIRREYSWVDEATYRRERASILSNLLGRQSIYSTTFFKEKYEQQARKNLARALQQLCL